MRFGQFELETDTDEYVSGIALIITNNDAVYDNLVKIDKNKRSVALLQLISQYLPLIEPVPAYQSLTWALYDNTCVCCMVDTPVLSQEYAEDITNSVYDIMDDFDEISKECDNLNLTYYKLDKLSDIYTLPRCKGKVLSDKKGEYYLLTSKILDDFLIRKSPKEERYLETVVQEIDDIYQTLE